MNFLNKNPLVTVLINCYNGSQYLNEAINSVLNQTYSNWEIIFWDNQSSDQSAKIFKSYKDPRLKYFYALKHTSLGIARKFALKEAKGEFCGILDCDDVWLPKKLELQLTQKPLDETVGVIYSDYNIISSDGLLKRASSRSLKYDEGYIFNSLLTESITVCWPTVLFNRNIWISSGSFCDLKYLEDLDILLRIAIDYRFVFINEKLANYRVHSNQLSVDYNSILNEKTYIFNYWENLWNNDLTKSKLELLNEGRSKAHYTAGVNAVFNNNSGLRFFLKSLKIKFNIITLLFLILSLFGPKFTSLIISKVRKLLGYSEYF